MADAPEPIAIVGMACRLPGDVNSPASFWEMLLSQRSGCSARVPASRFPIDCYHHEDLSRPGSFTSKGGYFLSGDLAEIDPSAFGISPIEAKWLDPQQRKLLEVVWECFESSGTPLNKVSGTDTGVFVGCFTNDWQSATFGEHDFRHAYAATGVDPGLLSTRINHVFNLRGPSSTINTACSSSVTALHQACNSLLAGDCPGAIVAGSNLIMLVDQHMNTAKLGVLSPTSECHTFDARADGYGRAEGVGALYVKKLSTAVRDGDNIRAVIRATAINTNGKVDGVGITYPGLEGQEQVIRKAYGRAQLDPLETGFFECHGTGTPTGDPLEVLALSRAMNEKRGVDDEPLLIGAVKTSIGHSEAASGIAAVMKAALAVETGVIPPVYGFKIPNPQIDFRGCKVKVVEHTTKWPQKLANCRRASVNSFGYGGSNGHVIVESVESALQELHRWLPKAIEPNVPNQNGVSKSSPKVNGFNSDSKKTNQEQYLLVFSAHDNQTLQQRILQYRGMNSTGYQDLLYTLAERRSHLSFRAFSVINSNQKLNAQLEDVNITSGGHTSNPPKRIAFIFTGQGAHWKLMGAQLFQTFSVFRQTICRLDDVLKTIEPDKDWTIEGIMTDPKEARRITDARFSQPMVTGLQIALVDLLAHWGISASVTVGHSSGEIAAAYAAGLVSASEAIVIADCRGKAVSPELTVVRGGMLAVGLGPEEAEALIGSSKFDGRVAVACRNSPDSTTLSGKLEDINDFKAIAEANQIFNRQLDTGGNAYHSHHMKQHAGRYKALMAEALSKLDLHDKKITSPKTRMESSVTLERLEDHSDVTEDYWCQNLVQPVLFDQALGQLIASEKSGDIQLIEIGPHPALSTPARQIIKAHGVQTVSYAPTLRRARVPDSIKDLLTLAGNLHIKGICVDLKSINSLPIGAKLLNELPPYPWQYKEKLWAEPRFSRERRDSKYPRHDILGRVVPGCTKDQLLWRNVLRQRDLPWLAHHMLGGDKLFPAAGYWSMAIEAIRQVRETRLHPILIESVSVQDVLISSALIVPDDEEGIEVLFSLSGDTEDPKALLEFQVSSCKTEVWTTHCKGKVGSNLKKKTNPRTITNQPAVSPGWRWYNQAFHNVGFDYGPSFNALKKIRSNPTRYEASAEATLRADSGLMKGESRYLLHPGTIDGCLQLILIATCAGKAREMTCGFIPVKADDVTIWTPTVAQAFANGQALAGQATSWAVKRGHSSVLMGAQMSADGDLLVDIKNLRAVAYEAALPPQKRDRNSQKNFPHEYFTKLEWKPDIDQLSLSIRNELEPARLAELAVHKNLNMRILAIGSEDFCVGVWRSATGKNKEFVAASDETFATREDLEVVRIGPKTGLRGDQWSGKAFELVLISPGFDKNCIGGIEALLKPDGQLYGLPKGAYCNGQYSNGVDVSLNGGGKAEKKLTIVCPPPSHSTSSLLNPIQACAAEDGWSVTVAELGKSEISPESEVIMLVESEKPMLVNSDDHTFRAIQHVLMSAASVVWITNGALLSSQGNTLRPRFSLVNGLMRSFSHDLTSLRMATLDVDVDSEDHKIIADVAISMALKNMHIEAGETEVILKDGLAHISRLVPHPVLNDDFPDIGRDSSTTAITFEKNTELSGSIVPEKPFAVVSFAEQQLMQPQTTNMDNGVFIKVCEAGLNQEVVDILASHQDDPSLCYEIGGIVSAVGCEVEGLVPGDRVVGFVAGGNYSTHVEIPQQLCVKVEKFEPFQSVMAMLLVNIISIHVLDNLAHINAGETILITGGTGVYGLHVAHYAQSRGAIVYLSLSSQAETMYLRGALHLPANRVITVAPGTKLCHEVSEITNGSGFDIVVISAKSADRDEAWKSVSDFGRLIQLGKATAGAPHQQIAANMFDRGASFHSFDWQDALQRKPTLIKRLLQRAITYFRKNNLGVGGQGLQLVQTVTLRDINQAVKTFSNSVDSEKVIVSYTDTIGKPVTAHPLKKHATFDPKASYILVGCLGGLGRSLSTYMVKNGAKNLVFLGRSGASSTAAKQLIQELHSDGVNAVVIKGDVSIYQDVFECVETATSIGPVKGVVHAPMVLQDTSFERMTPQQFRVGIKGKIYGAINLHEAVASHKASLDFFVMTSSVSGILGTPGQANYAAANTFLDSFATYRKNLGLPATSIALPMLLEVGWVAENNAEDILENFGIYGIDEAELIDTLDIAIMTSSTRGEYSDGNFVVGLEPRLLADVLKRANRTKGFYTHERRFAYVQRAILASAEEKAPGDTLNNSIGIQRRMKAAGSMEEAVELATAHILGQLSKMLLIPRDECVPEKQLSLYGLDSMLGTELRSWLFKEFGVDISYQQLVGAEMDGNKLALRMCGNRLTNF